MEETDKIESSPSAELKLPFCTAMVICEVVIEGVDHAMSAIRIVDAITLKSDAPLGENVEMHALKMLVLIKKGDAIGEFGVLLTCKTPKGSIEPIGLLPLKCIDGDPPECGINAVCPVVFRWDGPGRYWFEASIGGKLLMRIPFKVGNPGDPLTYSRADVELVE